MINKEIEKQILEFNKIYKNYDELYQNLSKFLGLNRVQTGVLYTIEEFNRADIKICTQRDITDRLLYSKQSINNAVKQLCQEGFVSLEAIEGNQKSKNIVLTEKGKHYNQEKLSKIVEMENIAFERLGNSDRRELLYLFNRIQELLQEEYQILIESFSKDN